MVARIKKIAQLIVKITVTLLCLYFVYRKIDIQQLQKEFKDINVFYLFPAILFFIISKIISSFRLNTFFRETGMVLKEKINLKLYWLGMFYNLFLPGGIGGDGYKVYLLQKYFKVNVKKIIAAVFIDRVSGVLALTSSALLFAAFIKTGIPLLVKLSFLIFIPLMYFIYRWILKKWFADFFKINTSTNLQAFYVQLMQMICVIFILLSLNIHHHFPDYLLIFLVSSVVAVLPLTIGGVGAREVVFLYGAKILLLDIQTSIAVSLLFFLITALVSLWGVVYSFQFPETLKEEVGSKR
jgi:glycosyltransferase 2 family protein